MSASPSGSGRARARSPGAGSGLRARRAGGGSTSTAPGAGGASGGGGAASRVSPPRPLRIAFLHPDLGLGGAERLVVDAAAGLARRGHDVTMFTSHYSADRSFAETRQGLFPVIVYGDWMPRQVLNRLHIVFATLRALWLAACVCLGYSRYEVFVCDQISAYVPVLRVLSPRSRILFYCHFPDQLLSARTSALKRAYRVPFDLAEEVTTGMADQVVVNSRFTRGVFDATFKGLAGRVEPDVLYPCIDTASITPLPRPAEALAAGPSFLSINRYERKKDVALAVRALAALRADPARYGADPALVARARLTIAGGYDTRVQENVEYHAELVSMAREAGMAEAVTFLRSFSDEGKRTLLAECTAVVYTPSNEHFGIVPVECMAAGRPVIAVASGGPLESIKDGTTGLLCEPTPEAFAAAMARLMVSDHAARASEGAGEGGGDGDGEGDAPKGSAAMGAAGRRRVEALFSRDAFADRLEGMCRALVGEPPIRYMSAPTLCLCGLTAMSAALTAALFVAMRLRDLATTGRLFAGSGYAGPHDAAWRAAVEEHI